MKMPKILVSMSLSWMIWIPIASSADLYKVMQKYFQDSLPGQGFVPAPYGADSRFQPKTIWIYVDGVQKRAAGGAKQKAWVVASSGRAVFDDIRVPLQRDPIALPSSTAMREAKWGLATSVAGALRPELNLNASVDAAITNGIEIDISIGEAEVEYCYYFDMLAAQDENIDVVSKLLMQVKTRYSGTLPQRRTIVAAIRVKDVNISLANSRNIDISANAALSSLVKALGLSWNSKSSKFEGLGFKNWRYIAYTALYGSESKLVSEGGDAKPPMTREADVAAEDNLPFSRIGDPVGAQ